MDVLVSQGEDPKAQDIQVALLQYRVAEEIQQNERECGGYKEKVGAHCKTRDEEEGESGGLRSDRGQLSLGGPFVSVGL